VHLIGQSGEPILLRFTRPFITNNSLVTNNYLASYHNSLASYQQLLSRCFLWVSKQLDKLDTPETTGFSNPQAFSGALALLRTLQPGAFVLLNPAVSWVSLSNYY